MMMSRTFLLFEKGTRNELATLKFSNPPMNGDDVIIGENRYRIQRVWEKGILILEGIIVGREKGIELPAVRQPNSV